MLKKSDDGRNISETGNWNVAADFSKLKIMKPLYLADEYEDIARYGQSSLIDQLININISQDRLKVIGLERLIDILIKLIKNSKFAIKYKTDQDILKKMEVALIRMKKLQKNLYHTVTSSVRRTRELKIHEDKFLIVLEAVLEIKSEINKPLNRSHLIFTDKEEFDPRKRKQELKERMIHHG